MSKTNPNNRVICLLECCRDLYCCITCTGLPYNRIYLIEYKLNIDAAAKQAGFKSGNEALDSLISWFKSSNVPWPFFTKSSVKDFKNIDRELFKIVPPLLSNILIFSDTIVWKRLTAARVYRYKREFSSNFTEDVEKLITIFQEVISVNENSGNAHKIIENSEVEEENIPFQQFDIFVDGFDLDIDDQKV